VFTGRPFNSATAIGAGRGDVCNQAEDSPQKRDKEGITCGFSNGNNQHLPSRLSHRGTIASLELADSRTCRHVILPPSVRFAAAEPSTENGCTVC